ncbi:hypothetical protein LTR10_011565 [Elasticomyces elasticus]|uniref:Cyclase n=1 Tax=Exophiala sideris TaxID=1016849 RepID=A0ABR0JEV1_9EURO|nr:hypothetical protein LTR10_011565 [Elasticomyces elasticus]KAK5061759.1 hypothetical protein LTR69_004942 [Exophiala sideris]
MQKLSVSTYPDFDSLPKVEGQPHGSAWGLWGDDDELGTLNYLTPDVVKSAVTEVNAGVSIQLDLPLDTFTERLVGREPFEHHIIDFKERLKGTPDEVFGHDDMVTFNTQSGSQWDGLRHIAVQHCGKYYNGLEHRTVDEEKENGHLGIHRWAERGGIVGRGVLLDYCSWREQTAKPAIPADSTYSISTDELEEVAKHQGVRFHIGDILIIRSGFTTWHTQAGKKEREEALQRCTFIGMEASMQSVRWLWDHHFAAVAGDTIAFESQPIPFNVESRVTLHEWLLGHWGTPIGELWDLERLSNVCQEKRQWSFLLTSAPLHVFGGVASPPNVLAIL